MSVGGWVFLGCSLALVWTLMLWCLLALARSRRR